MVAMHVNNKMLENHVFWRLMLFNRLTCCSCYNLQGSGFLMLPLTMMQSHRQTDFCAKLMYHETDPGWEDNPVWQTGLPALAGHDTYHVNVTKLNCEGVWSSIPAKNQSRSQHSTWECNIWLDKDQHLTLQFNYVVLLAIVKTRFRLQLY